MVCFDVHSYNPVTFDLLPSLLEANKAFGDAHGTKALPSLGKIFSAFNQHKNFGLIMLHKHFLQSSSELTVEVVSVSKTISMPWTLSSHPSPVDAAFLQSQGFELTSVDKMKLVRPHSWTFNSDGTLSPYEFFVTDDDHQIDTIPQDFLSALHQELVTLNLDKVLGLHLLHRNPDRRAAVETSDDSVRANLLDLKTEFEASDEADMVNVIWTFSNETGDAEQACRCKLNVGQHTGWHY